MPSAPTSAGELIDLLRKSGVAAPGKLAGVSDLALSPDPQKAAAALVAQGVITRFQAQQLLAGRHRGFRIGAYVIQDLLGRGGMGAVYLAEHTDLHRKVAIKVLVPGKDEDHKLALERFQREARAAAALDHPNIVRIFDVSRQNDTPYLVMEFVEGETLQQILDRDGAIPYPTAAEYVAQAAAGLQHAHEKGFVHRDIKPGNLMLDKTGAIKILDMGLARSSSSEDKLTEQLDNGAVVGTADFIAPEQGLNQPGVDGRADIYSLGATFFSLIIGKPPFQGNTTQKLLQHQLRSAPTLASLDATLPKGLSAVVAKMLAKKPADRYQSPAEAIAALAPWMGNSARVQAGLSRTKLAQGADLQATLSEIGRGTSRRLNAPSTMTDSGEVDPSSAAQDTGAVAGAVTTREAAGAPAPERLLFGLPRKKAILAASIGLGVLVIGGVVGWAAFGRGKTPAAQPTADNRPRSEQQQNPVPKVEPKVEPKKNPTPVVTPKVEPSRDVPVYKFEASELAPFRVRLKGGNVTDGKRGALPTGVAVYALRPDTEAEFSAGPVDGTAALSITRLGTATGSQAAFELERESSMQGLGLKLKPDTDHKVRVKYRTGAGQIEVSVHTIAGFKSAGYKVFGTTGDRWATAELPFRRGAEPLRLAIATLGEPRAPVAIAGVEVVEIPRAPVGERTLFRMDVAGQKPFAIRSGLTHDPANPNRREFRLVSRTGAEPPAGWSARVYNKDSEMEYFSQEVGGAPVLGIRGASGPGSAMLFMPKFDCPTGGCRLRFEYDASVREGRFAVRFKPADNRPAWDVVKPPVTGGAWRTEELEFDLRGAAGGYFEFHNTDERPSGAVRIRDVVVTETQGALAEKVLYRLDAADLPTFQNTKEGRQKKSGGDDPKLPGVYFGGWKPESASEWECKTVAGAKALAITNTSEVVSAQIGLELEQASGIALKFEPGQRVRVRVVYRTAGKGRGSVYIQTVGERKVPAYSELPNSNGAWATVDVVATRAAHPFRCLVDTKEPGAGNTLFVRSVTVSDAGIGTVPVATAAPTPKTPAADDPANWAEGATVYALDVAKIPAFRVVKEKSTRTTGEPEQLPPGIGCHCWKEGAVGEFRREEIDGVPALGLTNFNNEKSGQFFFGLEGGMKLALAPGKAYRVKVGYMARNDATGTATVHVVPGFKGIGSRTLPNTGERWATSAVSFVRPAADEKVEVRMVIDNTSVGEGNIVWVRSLEIVELIPPKK